MVLWILIVDFFTFSKFEFHLIDTISWISIWVKWTMNAFSCLATLLMIMSHGFVNENSPYQQFVSIFWRCSVESNKLWYLIFVTIIQPWRSQHEDKGHIVLLQQSLPGLPLQYPPPVCQRGPPEQCPDSAAPEPPARYTSYSRNLRRSESRWDSGGRDDDISCIFFVVFSVTFSPLSELS